MSKYICFKKSTKIRANEYICQHILEYIRLSKYSIHTAPCKIHTAHGAHGVQLNLAGRLSEIEF